MLTFSFVHFSLLSWIRKHQNNSYETIDKTAGAPVAAEVGKERMSKEGAGSGETFTAEHSELRSPDLCRKQKEEVVIMWLITMCRSEKF